MRNKTFKCLKLFFFSKEIRLTGWKEKELGDVSDVFQNFDVHFWTLLKAEKVRSWSSFWRKKNIFLKIKFSNFKMNL